MLNLCLLPPPPPPPHFYFSLSLQLYEDPEGVVLPPSLGNGGRVCWKRITDTEVMPDEVHIIILFLCGYDLMKYSEKNLTGIIVDLHWWSGVVQAH